METLTIDKAREADWLCSYWVVDPPEWCITTGKVSGYMYGDEEVSCAIVLFANAQHEATAIELEHLRVKCRAVGLLNQLEAGEESAWEAGWSDAKGDEEGVIR